MTNLTPPETRIDYDIHNLKKLKHTSWVWRNLYNILDQLSSDVEALQLGYSGLMNLAYEWDSRMANRFISPYLYGWVKGQIDELNIAEFLKFNFADKWNRIFDAFQTEYNALFPYNITETEHIDEVKDEDKTTESTDSSTSSNTYNDSESSNVDNKVFGFNSEVGVDDTTSSQTASSQSSDTRTGSNFKNGTEGFTADNDTDRTMTRTGNTGNIMTQQLLDAEWETRKHVILEMIRDDITNTLTLSIYENDI